MLPIANLHLKDLYQSTFQFLSSYSPFTTTDDSDSASDSDSSFPLTPTSAEKECPSLRDELDAADRTHCHPSCSCRSFGPSIAASTLYSMRREHDATKTELSKSQAEVTRWEERCKSLEKTLRETRALLKVRDQEIQALKRERGKNSPERQLRERASTYLERRRSRDIAHQRSNSNQSQLSQQIRLSGDWSDLRDDETSCNRRRSGSDPHRDNISTVSEEERAQARSSETFLNKVDVWSGAQVIQAVQDLNSEILQFAASATELCTFSKQRSVKVNQTSSEVATRLGDALSRLLVTRDHSQDPMLVQLALQGCISYCVSRALSSFCIGYQSKANITLTQIYTHMSQSGEFQDFSTFAIYSSLQSPNRPHHGGGH